MGCDQNKIQAFWDSAYNHVSDAGYRSNNQDVIKLRASLEIKDLNDFIAEYTVQETRGRALDVGCGNGKFSRTLATIFASVDAVDLSHSVIRQNNELNDLTNCHYYCEDVLEFLKERSVQKYDLIYVGGVLTYVEDDRVSDYYDCFFNALAENGLLIVRETVVTKKSIKHETSDYLAYYRLKDSYINDTTIKVKQNLAYKTQELYSILEKLHLSFLARVGIHSALLRCLLVKRCDLESKIKSQKEFLLSL